MTIAASRDAPQQSRQEAAAVVAPPSLVPTANVRPPVVVLAQDLILVFTAAATTLLLLLLLLPAWLPRRQPSPKSGAQSTLLSGRRQGERLLAHAVESSRRPERLCIRKRG